jgi:hypothetical protein
MQKEKKTLILVLHLHGSPGLLNYIQRRFASDFGEHEEIFPGLQEARAFWLDAA